MKRMLIRSIGAAATAALITTTQAASFTGGIWLVPEATSQNAILGSIPLSAANITFTLPGGGFSFVASTGAGTYTELGWLLSEGSVGSIVGSAADKAAAMDNGTTATLMEISGIVHVTAGQTWTFTHDDGVSLYVNGVLQSNLNPGPTPASTETTTGWGGATGNYLIQLVYGENSGSPAELEGNLGTPLDRTVPDGGTTVALLGMGLAGLAGLARRVRAS